MRWVLGIIFAVCLTVYGTHTYIKEYPYRTYSNWINGKEWNKYYFVPEYKTLYLAPTIIEEIPEYKEDYSQLWKEFSLGNSKVPLPVRHPLFQTVPLVESTGEHSFPKLGMILLAPNHREISRIYTFPTSLINDYTLGQELFKLPFVRVRLLKHPVDKVWRDVFSHKIDVRPKPLEEMIYDLYILHIRSKILPEGTLKYALLKEGKAIIEIPSKDKDYTNEIILTYSSGTIYSFAIRTERNNQESLKLRSKFFTDVSFNPTDPAMGKFLYTEFKQLNYARQVDQEGMLYLFAAWTQDLNNVDMLKEMIFFLERGRNHSKQLNPLYKFSLKHYGKTFTTKNIFNQHDDPNLVLQRKIEIEKIEKTQQELREKGRPPEVKELTPDEKMNLYLKKAREEEVAPSDDLTVH